MIGNKIHRRVDSLQRQSGAILVVSLIILLVLTIAALSSSRSILLQEKMTGAVREGHLALQAAESAIKDGEEYVEGVVSTGDFSSAGTNGLYTTGETPAKSEMWGHADWSDNTKYAEATTANSDGVPLGKYMVEIVNADISSTGDSGDVNTLNLDQDYTMQGAGIGGFRVTARGEGRDAQSVRMIQTYYGKRL